MRITSDARATSGEERGAPYANDRRKEGRKERARFMSGLGGQGRALSLSPPLFTRLPIPTSPEVGGNSISKLRPSAQYTLKIAKWCPS